MIYEGSFLWQWASSWAPLNGMTIAIVLATLAVFATKWTPINSIIKTVIIGGVTAAVPLGLYQLGVIIPIHTDIEFSLSRHDLFTYMSFYGTIMSVGISVPYLFHQIMRTKSEKYATYVKQTGLFSRPMHSNVPSPVVNTIPATSGANTQTNNSWTNGQTLKFEHGPNSGDTLALENKTYTIGRSKENDIVVDDPTVSRSHARVTCQGNQFYVEDLNSAAGTKVDGQTISKTMVMPGASLQMGNTKFEVNGSAKLVNTMTAQESYPNVARPNATRIINTSSTPLAWIVGTSGTAIGQSFNLLEGNNTVGRDSSNQVVISDPYVSRQQAIIRVNNGHMQVFDLGSSAGTKVNHKLLSGSVLAPNSIIKVGETELSLVSVENPQQFSNPSMSGRTMVEHKGEQLGVLIVKSGVDAGKTFTLKSGDNTIGRSNNTNIQLNDDSVSRQHAIVRVQDGKLIVIDAGSTDGTTVDGQPVQGYQILNGDVLTLGRSEFTIMTAKSQVPSSSAV